MQNEFAFSSLMIATPCLIAPVWCHLFSGTVSAQFPVTFGEHFVLHLNVTYAFAWRPIPMRKQKRLLLKADANPLKPTADP